jgi:hypothetical protein
MYIHRYVSTHVASSDILCLLLVSHCPSSPPMPTRASAGATRYRFGQLCGWTEAHVPISEGSLLFLEKDHSPNLVAIRDHQINLDSKVLHRTAARPPVVSTFFSLLLFRAKFRAIRTSVLVDRGTIYQACSATKGRRLCSPHARPRNRARQDFRCSRLAYCTRWHASLQMAKTELLLRRASTSLALVR